MPIPKIIPKKFGFTPLENARRETSSFLTGFTLVEILVVISIIGILASILVASTVIVRRKSRDARRVINISQMQKALDLYFDANSSYPVGIDAAGLDQIMTAGFMPLIQTDPLTGNSYRYNVVPTTCATGCTNYHMGANLEESTNPSLASDHDGTDGFNGVNGTCESSTGDDLCYDVAAR